MRDPLQGSSATARRWQRMLAVSQTAALRLNEGEDCLAPGTLESALEARGIQAIDGDGRTRVTHFGKKELQTLFEDEKIVQKLGTLADHDYPRAFAQTSRERAAAKDEKEEDDQSIFIGAPDNISHELLLYTGLLVLAPEFEGRKGQGYAKVEELAWEADEARRKTVVPTEEMPKETKEAADEEISGASMQVRVELKGGEVALRKFPLFDMEMSGPALYGAVEASASCSVDLAAGLEKIGYLLPAAAPAVFLKFREKSLEIAARGKDIIEAQLLRKSPTKTPQGPRRQISNWGGNPGEKENVEWSPGEKSREESLMLLRSLIGRAGPPGKAGTERYGLLPEMVAKILARKFQTPEQMAAAHVDGLVMAMILGSLDEQMEILREWYESSLKDGYQMGDITLRGQSPKANRLTGKKIAELKEGCAREAGFEAALQIPAEAEITHCGPAYSACSGEGIAGFEVACADKCLALEPLKRKPAPLGSSTEEQGERRLRKEEVKDYQGLKGQLNWIISQHKWEFSPDFSNVAVGNGQERRLKGLGEINEVMTMVKRSALRKVVAPSTPLRVQDKWTWVMALDAAERLGGYILVRTLRDWIWASRKYGVSIPVQLLAWQTFHLAGRQSP